MENVKAIIEKGGEFMLRDLAEWMRNNYIKVLFYPKEEQNDFVSSLFTLSNKKLKEAKESQIEGMKYLIYLFFILLNIDSEQLPKISLCTSTRRLFTTSLSLKTNKVFSVDRTKQLRYLFEKKISDMQSGFDIKTFYSTPSIYYIKVLPSLLLNSMGEPGFNELVSRYLPWLTDLSNINGGINYSYLVFLSELLQCVAKSRGPICNEILPLFTKIFTALEQCPSTALQLFFSQWFLITKICKDPVRRQHFSTQIEIISHMFDEVSKYKYHELSRSFQWWQLFLLMESFQTDEQNVKFFNLLACALRTINRFDTLAHIQDVIPRFVNKLTEQHVNYSNPWPLDCFHAIFTTVFDTLTQDLSHFKLPIVSQSRKHQKTKRVLYRDQPLYFNELTGFDNTLFTEIPCEIFQTQEEADEMFRKEIQIAESVKNKLLSMRAVLFHLVPRVTEICRDEINKDSEIGSLIFMSTMTSIRSFVQFTIMANYAYTILSQFKSEKSTKEEVKKTLNHSDFFKRLVDMLEALPIQSTPTVAEIFVLQLFTYQEKEQITLPFVNMFDVLNREKSTDSTESNSLFYHIVSKMIERTYDRLPNFNSRSMVTSNRIFRWMLLTLRIGWPKATGIPNTCFGSFTYFYFKMIEVTLLTNLRWISNQSTALKTAQVLIDVENDVHPDNHVRKGHQSRLKMRQIKFEDVHPMASKVGANAFMDYFNVECDQSSLSNFLPAFEAALRSGDENLTSKAAAICHKFFVSDLPDKWNDNGNEQRRDYFRYYFSSIATSSPKIAYRTLRDIPILTPLFLQQHREWYQFFMNAKIDQLQFNITQILDNIVLNAGETEEEFQHIFAFLTCTFDYVSTHLNLDHHIIQHIMKHATTLFCRAFSFDSMTQTLQEYAVTLNEMFAPYLARGEFVLYFLCLLDVISTNRSEMAQTATHLAQSLIARMKDFNPSELVIQSLLSHLLSFFQPQTGLFSILTGFSLIQRYFPGQIKITHLRAFLIQLTEMAYGETQFFTVLKQFLKLYLEQSDDKTKFDFVQMTYEIICPLSTMTRMILSKRAEKLGIQIDVHNWADVVTTDRFLLFQRTEMVLICGADFEMAVTPEIEQMFLKLLLQKPEGIPVMENIARILQLFLAMIKNPIAGQVFISNDLYLSQILNMLCHSLTSHYSPVLKLAKKCVKHVQMMTFDKKFEKQLYEYAASPDKIFTPFGPQPERISFYRRFTRILPQSVPLTVIDTFASSIMTYEQMSEAERIKYVPQLQNFLKAFTVKSLMTLPAIRERMLAPSGNTSNFETVFIVMIKLFQRSEIPYKSMMRKDMIKFVKLFLDETLELLYKPCNYTNEIALEMHDFIIHDKSNEIINGFLKAFPPTSELLHIHPSISFLVRSLTTDPNYAKMMQMREVVRNSFDVLVSVCKDYSRIHDHKEIMLFNFGHALINVLAEGCDPGIILEFAGSFTIPYLIHSDLYKEFFYRLFTQRKDSKDMPDLIHLAMHCRDTISPITYSTVMAHAIKSLKMLPAPMGDYMFSTIVQLSNEEQFLSAHMRASYHLIVRYIPSDKLIVWLLNSLVKKSLTSMNPEPVVYGIRFCTELLKNNKLPNLFYKEMLKIFLKYRRFLEAPYAQYLAQFLNTKPEYLDRFSSTVIKNLSFFFVDRNLPQQISNRVGSFFILVPKLLNFLPFSYPTLTTLQLEQKLSTAKTDDDVMQCNELFMHLYRLFSVIDGTEEEFQYYGSTAFKLLIPMMNQPNTKRDPSENFFIMLLKTNHNFVFPTHIFDLIGTGEQTVHSYHFMCISTKFLSEEQILKYEDHYIRALKYTQEKNNYVNNQLLILMSEKLLSTEKLCTKFMPHILTSIQAAKQYKENPCLERNLILKHAVIKSHHEITPQPLIEEVIDNLPNVLPQYKPTILVYTLRCIGEIHPHLQAELLKKTVNKCLKDGLMFRGCASVFAHVAVSDNISPFAKESIMKDFPLQLRETDPEVISEVYNITNSAQSTEFRFRLTLVYAKQASPSKRIKLLDQIRAMLPEEPDKAIVTLIHVLPPEYWTNEFLPLITALITSKTKFWFPIFSLSNCLVRIASDLFATSLIQAINDSNVTEIRNFYSTLLEQKYKQKLSSVLSGITFAFFTNKIPLPSLSVQKAALSTGDFSTLFAFMKPDQISERYMYPHHMNDIVYAISAKSGIDVKSRAAVALSFLAQYEAAAQLFEEIDCNTLILSKMKEINSRFIRAENPSDIYEVLKPLYHENTKGDRALSCVVRAAKLTLLGNMDEANVLINNAESSLLRTMRTHQFMSLYEREKVAVIENMVYTLKHIETTGGIPYPPDRCHNFINPALYTALSDFSVLVQKQIPKHIKHVETFDDPIFPLMPTDPSAFKSVAGYTTRGFFLIGEPQVQEYMSSIEQQLEAGPMRIGQWRQLATFCYHLFLVHMSPDSFQSALVPYIQVFNSKDEIPVFAKQESAARIITLMRIMMLETDERYRKIVIAHKDIFSSPNAVIWRFWLQQIVALSKQEWFFDIVSHMFRDMAYRSTLYGKKLDIPYFNDIKLNAMAARNPQIMMMGQLEHFFNTIRGIDFHEYEEQKKLFKLSTEASRLPQEYIDGADLVEIRKRKPTNSFESSLRKLTLARIKRIDFREFTEKSKNLSQKDFELYIKDTMGYKEVISNYTNKIHTAISELNANLPFIIPVRFENTPHIYITRIHDDIRVLSEDLVLIHASTSTSPRQVFLIQTSNSEEGFHPSVLTLSNVLFFFKGMINSHYQTRSRGVNLNAAQVFEIGTSMLLVALPADIITLKELFTTSTMMQPEEWVEQNTVNGALTESGKESAEKLDNLAFTRFMLRRLSQRTTTVFRSITLRSFAAGALVRTLFHAKYPSMPHIMFCYSSSLFPLLHIDFDFEDGQEIPVDSVRLSPNIEVSMGPCGLGQLTMTIAAVAQALVANFESVRSFLEIFVGDRYGFHGQDRVNEERAKIEQKLFMMAPPSHSSSDDAVEWIQSIESLIDSARDPSTKAVEDIPWF